MTSQTSTPGIRPDGATADWFRAAAAVLLLGLVCYFAQRVAIILRVPPSGISTIWLAGGVLLGVLLAVSPKRWGGFLAGAAAGVFTGLAGDVPTPALMMFVIMVCGLVAAVAASVRWATGGPPRFDQFRHVLVFLAVAGSILPIVAALGAAVLAITSTWREGFWQVWPPMVLSAVVGIVTVAPSVAVAVTGGASTLRSATTARWVEAAVLAAGVFGVSIAVFGGAGAGPGLGAVWLLYVPLPMLLWAAARFGAGGTSLVLLVVALVSTAYAVNGQGPFASHSAADNVLSLQLSMLAMGVPLLLLAAVAEERRRAGVALAASECEARRQLAELSTVYRTAPVGLAFIDADLRFAKVNDHLAEIGGRPADDYVGRSLRQVLPTALAGELEVIFREVIAKNRPALDLEIRGTAVALPGSERTWLASYFPVAGDHGAVLGVNTVVREITAEKQAAESLRRSHAEIQDLAGRLIAAQEAERTRIARELHDDINQRLAALAIGLSGLKRRLAGGPGGEADEWCRLQSDVARLTDDIRLLSHELHPGVLQHAGLVAALDSHCVEVRRGNGVNLTFDVRGDVGDVPPDVALCLYRVAQESLRNVVRHANARRVWLTLTRAGGELEVVLTDDGDGFDATQARRAGGLGLISLDERVRLAGGNFQVRTPSGGGTEVRARVPLRGGAG